MGKRLTLILGGVRSGKSVYAQTLAAERGQAVLFVATAEAGDKEMAARIAAHQAQRPPHWHTLEAPRGVGEAIQATQGEPEVILLDCLTLLANNVLAGLPEALSNKEVEDALAIEINALLAAYEGSSAEWIIVSNEVGLGVVPPYPLGRVYRDSLGCANQELAATADEVLFMTAGLPLRLK